MQLSLLERLRTDFGKKTLGELIQDREAAAAEIERLTKELDKHRALQFRQQQSRLVSSTGTHVANRERREPGTLLRLREVCAMVALSRSTIYAAMGQGNFPSAIRIGKRSVRWRATDIAMWLKANESTE